MLAIKAKALSLSKAKAKKAEADAAAEQEILDKAAQIQELVDQTSALQGTIAELSAQLSNNQLKLQENALEVHLLHEKLQSDEIRGPQGPQGESLEGPRGLAGVDGERGLQGLTGPMGPMPSHKWNSTLLSFENPDGTYGPEVDLKGPAGNVGPVWTGGSQVRFKREIQRLEAEIQTMTGSTPYTKQYDDTGTVSYLGEALPGTATSAATWRIKRITETGDDLSIEWADGVSDLTKVWDDRLTYTYS